MPSFLIDTASFHLISGYFWLSYYAIVRWDISIYFWCAGHACHYAAATVPLFKNAHHRHHHRLKTIYSSVISRWYIFSFDSLAKTYAEFIFISAILSSFYATHVAGLLIRRWYMSSAQILASASEHSRLPRKYRILLRFSVRWGFPISKNACSWCLRHDFGYMSRWQIFFLTLLATARREAPNAASYSQPSPHDETQAFLIGCIILYSGWVGDLRLVICHLRWRLAFSLWRNYFGVPFIATLHAIAYRYYWRMELRGMLLLLIRFYFPFRFPHGHFIYL